MAAIHQVISLGIGTPAGIPHFLLWGLSPIGALDPVEEATIQVRADTGTISVRSDVGTIMARAEIGTLHVRQDVGVILVRPDTETIQ